MVLKEYGTHRFSPNLAINDDIGRSSIKTKQAVEMGRLWNRLVNMENDHLTKNIFMWDKTLCKQRNWSYEMKQVMDLRILL